MRTATRDEIISVCRKLGFNETRRTDHLYMKKMNNLPIRIPNEHTDIGENLFHQILSRMKISKKRFEELLNK